MRGTTLGYQAMCFHRDPRPAELFESFDCQIDGRKLHFEIFQQWNMRRALNSWKKDETHLIYNYIYIILYNRSISDFS